MRPWSGLSRFSASSFQADWLAWPTWLSGSAFPRRRHPCRERILQLYERRFALGRLRPGIYRCRDRPGGRIPASNSSRSRLLASPHEGTGGHSLRGSRSARSRRLRAGRRAAGGRFRPGSRRARAHYGAAGHRCARADGPALAAQGCLCGLLDRRIRSAGVVAQSSGTHDGPGLHLFQTAA